MNMHSHNPLRKESIYQHATTLTETNICENENVKHNEWVVLSR